MKHLPVHVALCSVLVVVIGAFACKTTAAPSVDPKTCRVLHELLAPQVARDEIYDSRGDLQRDIFPSTASFNEFYPALVTTRPDDVQGLMRGLTHNAVRATYVSTMKGHGLTEATAAMNFDRNEPRILAATSATFMMLRTPPEMTALTAARSSCTPAPPEPR